MPTLESIEQITPKSILRHRPIGASNAPVGKRSMVTAAATPIVQRASRPRPIDVVEEWKHVEPEAEEEEDENPSSPTPLAQPMPKAATRHVSTPPMRSTPVTRSRPPLARRKGAGVVHQGMHPLLYLGMGMIAMLILWTLLSSVIGWFNTTMDDIRYGRPRTFQTDAWVGHNEQTGVPSHFIAINLNRHIEIIETPGGDASRARIYMGPQLYGANDDLVVVTLRFMDVNNDHKPDMIVSFQGSRIVFINDQGGFRPLQPSERPMVEQFLQHHG